MNTTSTIQNPIRDLPTNVAQLLPLDPQASGPGASSQGGFADLLRNFDAEPTPEPQAPQPTAAAPAPAPAPAASANQQGPAKTAVRQAQGADSAADAKSRLDTDPWPGEPSETGPVQGSGEPDGEPACTLHETRDPDAEIKGGDPTKTARLRHTPEAQKAKAAAAEAEAKGATDASAAAGVIQSQQALSPIDKSTDIRQPSTDLPPDKAVAEAQARANDRAQGHQQADRQAQVQAVQSAPLDTPTAAVQSFAAELKNSMPAAIPTRTQTLGLALSSAGALGASGTSAREEAAPAAPTAVNMPEPLDDAGFAGALGARLAILAKDGVQKAELHLNPADMGPVAVQITVDGQQAQVTFHAAQADTRGVLEQGLPDLAAALAANGLTLSGGGVFQQQQQQGRQGAQDGIASSGQRGVGGTQAVDGSNALPQGMPVGTRQRGVVDLYA